ncbi:MAG TPA: hypothetical protein VFZ09_45940 [Archangium sp.]|uniref:hypothetical protein n=1 Tax=Archangium sp. TaxID=1872627 RepID=UPI002E322BF9|nr:hypothetical protein [Archangium sp.]HEX5753623.1 hypothetical protein [Archangium sp.]
MTLIAAMMMAFSTAHAAGITSESWNTGRQKSLNATPDLRIQVQRLLEGLLPDADLVTPMVGDAYFADINGDSNLELLATVDYSGRGFYNNVVVVQQQQGQYAWTEARNNGRSIESLRTHLVDADGDGKQELVLERFMDRYEGARRVPTEIVIYRWNERGFKDDSDAFPEYYRTQVVPALEKKLIEASSKPSTSRAVDDSEVFALEAELSRAKRRGRIK